MVGKMLRFAPLARRRIACSRVLVILISMIAAAAQASATVDVSIIGCADNVLTKGRVHLAHASISESGASHGRCAPLLRIRGLDGSSFDLAPIPIGGHDAYYLIPTGRLGYFELSVLSPCVNGGAQVKYKGSDGSREALPYAIVPPVQDIRKTDGFLIGVQGNVQSSSEDQIGVALLKKIGFNSVAMSYQWPWTEPGEGDSLFRERGEAFERVSAGFPPPELFYISGVPKWAADGAVGPPGDWGDSGRAFRVPPKDLMAYKQYISRAVGYIMDKYHYAPQRLYEIFWEPVAPWGWYGTDDDLVNMARVASSVIHDIDPRGKVLGPTLSHVRDIGLFKRLVKKGLLEYLDVLSFHIYSPPPFSVDDIANFVASVNAISMEAVGRKLPVISTESGFREEEVRGEVNQAASRAQSIVSFKGLGLIGTWLFYLTDYKAGPTFGIMNNLEPGLPYRPSAVSPKPSVPVIRAVAECLDEKSPVRRVKVGDWGIDGFEFVGSDGRLVYSLWSAGVVYMALPTGFEVADAYGNILERSRGATVAKIEGLPVCVKSRDRLSDEIDRVGGGSGGTVSVAGTYAGSRSGVYKGAETVVLPCPAAGMGATIRMNVSEQYPKGCTNGLAGRVAMIGFRGGGISRDLRLVGVQITKQEKAP